MKTFKRKNRRGKKASRKRKYSKKMVGGDGDVNDKLKEELLKKIDTKLGKIENAEEKRRYFEAIELAIEALEQTDVNNGLLDAFYKSFEPTDIGKKRMAQLDNAENRDKLKILYFPSESNFVGKPGKVVKKNTYGDYAIVSSKPNTTFSTMLKKNFRSTEDFIAQLLQGREGPVKRKPIFEEDILITDRSFKNELAKKDMKEKIQEITDVFDIFIEKVMGGKNQSNQSKFESYFKEEGREAQTIDGIDDFKDKLNTLYKFRQEIREKLEKSDYSIAKTKLYSKDKAIKDLKKELDSYSRP